MTPEQTKQALENCSKDPIHIPGTIQGFGAILATDPTLSTVTHISSNFSDLFGIEPQLLLGSPLPDVFSSELQHTIANALGHPTIQQQRELLPSIRIKNQSYQLFVHRKGAQVIIECIPERATQDIRHLPLERAKAFMSIQLDQGGPQTFLREATERMRAILHMDRVKFYQFLADDGGQVIAESRHPEMASYLGLRFPAEDIPRIARELYVKTPIRVISDVVGEDVALLQVDGAEPLDMSLAVLRGKDKVHQQYLVNMGVASTLTVPIVVNEKLWGMFAAHHRTVFEPDPSMLNAAELAGKLISLRLQHAVERQRQAMFVSSQTLAKQLVVAEDSFLSTSTYWNDIKDELITLLDADGVALFVDTEFKSHGSIPDQKQIDLLKALINPDDDKNVVMDDLPNRFQGTNWGTVGGALLITVPGPKKVQLFFFRNRVDAKINWAGRPEKTIEFEDDIPRLHPRASFKTYLETVQNKCEEWTTDTRAFADALSAALTEAVMSQNDLIENRHRMGLLVRELNHRVRNILALVQSISQQSREDSQSVSAYAQAIEDRVLALSGAHNLLTRADMTGAVLGDLIGMIVKPHGNTSERSILDGPKVVFRPDAASILALLFHELASNAAKYGAFSVPEGRVQINWQIENEGVRIIWQERGGPSVSEPTKSGFGQSIITGALPYEFKGEADIAFLPEGIKASFWLPGDLIIDADVEAAIDITSNEVSAIAPALSHSLARAPDDLSLRALVVEDNFIVASSAKKLLLENGFSSVDAAATVEEALSYLSQSTYDFCLLDINLQGQVSTPVAQRVASQRIPFALASGYGSDGHEIAKTYDVPMLAKPMNIKSFLQVLRTLVRRT